MLFDAEKWHYMNDEELFELVRENYHNANQDYIRKQLSVASEYLTDEQKVELRRKGYAV